MAPASLDHDIIEVPNAERAKALVAQLARDVPREHAACPAAPTARSTPR